MKIKYLLLIIPLMYGCSFTNTKNLSDISSNVSTVELDADNNGAVDESKGGTNAITFSAARTNLDVYSKAEADAADDSGSDDQTALEVPITDSTGIIIAVNVEGALQENREAININSSKIGVTDEEQNVQSDWNSTSGDSFILNKPTIPVISNDSYDKNAWNGNLTATSKDSIRDKFEAPISIDATPSSMVDNSYNGFNIIGLNCGESLSQWDVVRLVNDDDMIFKSSAGVSDQCPAFGLSVATCVDGSPAIILKSGMVRNNAWNFTRADPVYLSTISGGLTQTKPSASGDCVQILGWAISANEVLFDFSRPYMEIP